ncbi:MAG: hypothetical protein ACKVZJ_09915 [Phycisphaerales bacterium]
MLADEVPKDRLADLFLPNRMKSNNVRDNFTGDQLVRVLALLPRLKQAKKLVNSRVALGESP